MSQKTVTISRLMDIVPPGTVDPTPFVYDKMLYTMAGLQAMALLTNVLMPDFKSSPAGTPPFAGVITTGH